jgi:Fe-S cluster assembly protein SufD
MMSNASSVEHYVAAFESFASNGGSHGAPEWLTQVRRQGIDAFTRLGFPTTRQEAWRFTNVRPIVETPFRLAATPSDAIPDVERRFLLGPDQAFHLVFVNGTCVADLGERGLPTGLVISSLARAIEEHPDLVRPHLSNSDASSGFHALNAAFIRDGAFVYVPKGLEVEQPIELTFLMTGGNPDTVTHPRNLIVVEDHASIRLVESYLGTDDQRYFTNVRTDVIVGDGARADCYRIQREGAQGFHVADTRSIQGRDSRYSLHVVPFGAMLSRHDIRMALDGEGGEGTLNGLYVMRDSQHVDHSTVIAHQKPNCVSHEYFNGILDDKARAVFNGRIVVSPGAQKTDSKQTNNNLLLSENARADSQPQLEIYADDVRCTHGATLGPLDENSRFYLRSRGIEDQAARNMLTLGFGMEVLQEMTFPAVRTSLEGLVRQRLALASGGIRS